MAPEDARRFAGLSADDQVDAASKLTAGESVQPWSVPRNVASIGWFASPVDVVDVLATLDEFADADPVLRSILTAHPGQDFGPKVSVLAHKMGAVPGVLAFAWVVEVADRRAAIVLITNDDERAFPETQSVMRLVQAAIQLFGPT